MKNSEQQIMSGQLSKQTAIEAPLDSASQSLFIELQQLIINSKSKLSRQVNSAISLLYWQIGKQINDEILKQKRAGYGQKIIKELSKKLSQEFGKGFQEKSLRRMIQFQMQFSDLEIVATLSRQLSWSHFVLLLSIKNRQTQAFYAHMSATEHWSVRTLRNRIDSMLYELDKGGIHVGEYLTALPSKEQLQQKLHQVMTNRLELVKSSHDSK